MEFIEQLKAFDKMKAENLTPNAIAIYFHLFMVNNRCGWKEWFSESDLWIERSCGISRRETVLKSLNLLKQKGFIDFERGTRKGQPSKYKILPLLNSGKDSGYDSAYNSGYDSAYNSGYDSGKDSGYDSAIPRLKTKTKDKRQVNNKGARVDVFAGESERVQDALRAFVEMRTKMRRPMTDRAKELLLSRLEELSGGDEFMKVQLLEQSIERGWQSVFPLSVDGNQKLSTRKSKLQENMEAAEIAIQMLEREEAFNE